jgi:predicted peroxiredoxin
MLPHFVAPKRDAFSDRLDNEFPILGERASTLRGGEMTMLRKLLVVGVLVGVLAAMPASADSQGSLFVNLTTEEAHRADMAMVFSKDMMERGHPVTIWLNDKGVFLATKENAGKFADQQKALSELTAKGATVIACPYCMKHYGVKDTDLLEGVKVGNPDLTSSLLFKDDTKTLTW